MLGAIYTGLSGMNAYSEGLMMISNNVANLNSPGYKGSLLSFNSLFSQGGGFLGSGRNGGGYGVSMGSSFTDFSQGQLQQTSNPLDLAIQGSGFLTVMNGDSMLYERTGSFNLDDKGFISDQQGNHLAVLNDDGTTSAFNADPYRTSKPVASTLIDFSGNVSPDNSPATVQTIKVFDSLGGEHDWTVTLTKSDGSAPPTDNDGNPIPDGETVWTVSVTDASGNTIDNGGTIAFKQDGTIDADNSTVTIGETLTNGASNLSVKLDFSTITAFSGNGSTLQMKSVDGNALGTLSAIGVNADGQVELSYTNGTTKDVGFVALTNFEDPQSLERVGNGLYRDASGKPALHLASNTNGVGKLMSGQLESSNVNLSSEFGELILIERGFQACSQVVSISNEMIQTLFGMRGQG
jgi:flagellar hook protein FlgE